MKYAKFPIIEIAQINNDIPIQWKAINKNM